MAKSSKTAKKSTTSRTTGGGKSTAETAAQLSKSLSTSAQQIWLAGLGAFGRAQAEGTRLFESLVKEGVGLEKTTRDIAGSQANEIRGAVESRVDQARERATETWDRLERAFDERVQSALVKLGVPVRDDVRELGARVDALTAQLARATGKPAAPRTAAKKAAGRKTAARKAPAKKAPASKTVAKKTAKTATRKAPARKRTAAATTTPG
ncbi:phasin family protein [Luteimonas sp. BDR2-5]|uniref:phasin family protein n=1 Tax=Proluteimonas luteida TaxID=2878685 RepID=UPI00272E67EA|nr:phasin family protein [Luteimonas sp. BDR2-5]